MNTELYITIGFLFLLFIFFILVVKTTKGMSKRRKQLILGQMDDIKASLDIDMVSINRDVVVRLDSILSKVLKNRYNNNLNCGENLKKARKSIDKDLYEDIWYYHKLRNRVVHENVDVTHEDAEKAFKVYNKLINRFI